MTFPRSPAAGTQESSYDLRLDGKNLLSSPIAPLTERPGSIQVALVQPATVSNTTVLNTANTATTVSKLDTSKS